MVRLVSLLWYWLRLHSGDPEVRAEAVEMLGKVGGKRAVASLIKALRDPDTMYEAAEALGKIGDVRAVKPLIETLADVPEGEVWSYGRALGKIGEPAVEPLIQFLVSARGQAQMAAADALGEIGDQRAVEPLIALLERGSDNAATALAEIGDPRAIQHVVNAMREGGDWACNAVAGFGAAAIPALIDALKSSDSEQRRHAALALGQIGSPEATQPLLEGLNDKDNTVRVEAIQSLDKIGETAAVTPLIGLLCDDDPEVVGTAAEALGSLGDSAAIEPLVHKLREGRIPIGWQSEVARALDSLGWQPSDPEDEARYYIARSRWEEAAALGSPAIPCLADISQIVPPFVCLKVIEALCSIRDKAVIEPLFNLLGNRDRQVRKAASAALKAKQPLGWEPSETEKKVKYFAGKCDWWKLVDFGEQSVETLLRFLRGGITEDHWEIIRALGEIGDARTFVPLVKLDRRWALDTRHRRAVSEALAKIGGPATPQLIELLDSGSRGEIVRALIRRGPADVEVLVEALGERNDAIRARAAKALRKIGKPAVGPLRRAMNSDDARVRKLAAETLKGIRT